MILAVGDGACLQVVLDHGEAMERGVGRVHSHAGGTLNRRHVSCGFAGRGIFFGEGMERGVRRVFLHAGGAPTTASRQLHSRRLFFFDSNNSDLTPACGGTHRTPRSIPSDDALPRPAKPQLT